MVVTAKKYPRNRGKAAVANLGCIVRVMTVLRGGLISIRQSANFKVRKLCHEYLQDSVNSPS
jgi:hypothetical protein